MSKKFLVVLGVVILLLLAGCAGLGGDDGQDPSQAVGSDEVSGEVTDEAMETEDALTSALNAEGLATIYETTTDSLDAETAEAFTAAISDDAGEPTSEGLAALEHLESIDELGDEQRDAVATSIADQGEVEAATLETISRVFRSPGSHQEAAFAHGLANSTTSELLDGELLALGLDPDDPDPELLDRAERLAENGYAESDIAYLGRLVQIADDEVAWAQAEAVGLLDEPIERGWATDDDVSALEDGSGDGLLNAKAASIDLDPAEKHTEVADIAHALAQDGYQSVDRKYLERVAELAESQDHYYGVWAQADELELLDEAVANGTVSDDQLWAIRNNASNRLLNGMEREFGTDPEKADTSGDGYEDHLKWGPMTDSGLEVNPTEVDVYVQMDSTTGVSKTSSSQLEDIRSTLETEPPADVGPINVHFYKCNTDVEPITSADEMDDRYWENEKFGMLGFHYLLINDGRIDVNGEEAIGAASGSRSAPWMVSDGHQRSTSETLTIAHELGHSMGIDPDDFDGVDSREYSTVEYNSVMNYNVRSELTFSMGYPFNDYEHMADNRFNRPRHTMTHNEWLWGTQSGWVEETC